MLEFDKSIEYYNKAITKNDTIEDTYFSLGSIYEEKKNYDKAIEMYRKGYKLNSNLSEAHCRLGFLYAKKSNYIYSKAHIMRAAQLGNSLAREFFDNDSLLWKDPFLRPDYKQIRLNIENKQSNLYCNHAVNCVLPFVTKYQTFVFKKENVDARHV